MAKWWGEDEAIAAGLYDPPGSSAAKTLKAETDRLKAGASDLGAVYPGAVPGQSPTADSASKATETAYKGWLPKSWTDPINKALGTIENLDPTSKNFDPSKAGAEIKIGLGDNAAKKIDEIQAAFTNWLPRLIVIFLGFIFVAVALAMFGIQTGPGQEIIRNVRNSIPR